MIPATTKKAIEMAAKATAYHFKRGKVSKSGPKLIQFWLWKGNVQNVKTKEDFGS